MEENKEVPVGPNTTSKKGLMTRQFSNKWLVVWFVIAPIILLAYFFWWSPKQACSIAVEYHPATQTIETDNVFANKQGVAEYYSYTKSRYESRQFKTKDDAVDYCMSLK